MMNHADATVPEPDGYPMDEGRISRQLRGLGEVAPPASLTPLVLAEIGLADAYERVDTPIRPAYVAFNREGV